MLLTAASVPLALLSVSDPAIVRRRPGILPAGVDKGEGRRIGNF
jgi:hypothetical protein